AIGDERWPGNVLQADNKHEEGDEQEREDDVSQRLNQTQSRSRNVRMKNPRDDLDGFVRHGLWERNQPDHVNDADDDHRDDRRMQESGARRCGSDWIQAAVCVRKRGVLFAIDNVVAMGRREYKGIPGEKVSAERECGSNKRQQDAPTLSRSLLLCLRRSHTQSLREDDACSRDTRQSTLSSLLVALQKRTLANRYICAWPLQFLAAAKIRIGR